MGTTDMVTALVSPVNKLLDIVSSMFGKAYEPKHMRKIADAKAYEIKVIGEAIRANSDLPIAYDKSQITIDATNFEELVKRAGNRLAIQEIVRQQNIENVVDYAYSDLKGQAPVDSVKPDDDWLLRFFSSVEDISNDEMQMLWGRLLAGEIKKPHSYSLRTLGTLKNLSSVEALDFSRACRVAIRQNKDIFIVNDETTLRAHGLLYSNMLSLQECGLLNADSLLHFTNDLAVSGVVIYSHKKRIIIVKNQSDKPTSISLQVFTMTKAATELARIVTPDESEQDAIINATYIKGHAPSCSVSVHLIIEATDDSSVRYQTEGKSI